MQTLQRSNYVHNDDDNHDSDGGENGVKMMMLMWMMMMKVVTNVIAIRSSANIGAPHAIRKPKNKPPVHQAKKPRHQQTNNCINKRTKAKKKRSILFKGKNRGKNKQTM